ncbi:MAG TPA: hypothetical protein DDW51_05440 [Cyanobacteria bacterium UBA11367]|nr:hypothetical protein [Cyanobacteria bacterium UBA11367]
MQVVFLLPPFTRAAGGVKTLAKTSIFAFIGMLPIGIYSNRQLRHSQFLKPLILGLSSLAPSP